MPLNRVAGSARLIALDWGTTSLRAYLLGDEGVVLDRRAEPFGILQLPDRGFAAAFDAITEAWRGDGVEIPSIASGMIGSAQGWIEAPYVDAPADAESIASGLRRVPESALWVVPGVAQRGERPDVLRGEETQLFGALGQRPALAGGATVVMPGTHSKWVRIADGRVERFTTYMTGELFAVLRGHSILGRLAGAEAASVDAATPAFVRGVQRARAGAGGLAGLLFSARSAVLVGDLPGAHSLEYLSGLLIGDEVRCGLSDAPDPKAIIGEPALCARYAVALQAFGVEGVEVLGETAPAGLWRVGCLAFPDIQRGEAASRRPVSGPSI